MQKTIIITGASRGIGLELVKILSENHRIIALSRNIESIKNLPHVEAYSVDFLDPTFVEKLDFKAFGNVDAVIHNAGKLINKPFEKTHPFRLFGSLSGQCFCSCSVIPSTFASSTKR
jgi:3-oxoacyl-[acyl-carrier protein] reductase